MSKVLLEYSWWGFFHMQTRWRESGLKNPGTRHRDGSSRIGLFFWGACELFEKPVPSSRAHTIFYRLTQRFWNPGDCRGMALGTGYT